MTTFDVSIVLTITAENEDEVNRILKAEYRLDEENPPRWGAIIIRELKTE